jgi:hypothetical protein
MFDSFDKRYKKGDPRRPKEPPVITPPPVDIRTPEDALRQLVYELDRGRITLKVMHFETHAAVMGELEFRLHAKAVAKLTT